MRELSGSCSARKYLSFSAEFSPELWNVEWHSLLVFLLLFHILFKLFTFILLMLTVISVSICIYFNHNIV